MRRWLVTLTVLGLAGAGGARAASQTVILSTTTSTQDSGLLDVLIPRFEQRTGYTVTTLAVGTGQALALAARGEADVALAHAPALERTYVQAGQMRNRRLVMFNDFVLVGPPGDPARLRGLPAADALRRIVERQARFVSRGDRSGTHTLELALWARAGVEPKGAWYLESGQGMGPTLAIAEERGAYALTDRATFLAFQKRLSLMILVERDRLLLNVYSVLEVNPANGPRVNESGGRALADFLVSPEAQALIRTFGISPYGQPLFFPAAGQREEDLGG